MDTFPNDLMLFVAVLDPVRVKDALAYSNRGLNWVKLGTLLDRNSIHGLFAAIFDKVAALVDKRYDETEEHEDQEGEHVGIVCKGECDDWQSIMIHVHIMMASVRLLTSPLT